MKKGFSQQTNAYSAPRAIRRSEGVHLTSWRLGHFREVMTPSHAITSFLVCSKTSWFGENSVLPLRSVLLRFGLYRWVAHSQPSKYIKSDQQESLILRLFVLLLTLIIDQTLTLITILLCDAFDLLKVIDLNRCRPHIWV